MSEIKPGILAVGVGPDVGEVLFCVEREVFGVKSYITGGPLKCWLCELMQDSAGYDLMTDTRKIAPAGSRMYVADRDLRPLRGPTEQITTDEPAEVTA